MRHSAWANQNLVDGCSTLSAEELARPAILRANLVWVRNRRALESLVCGHLISE